MKTFLKKSILLLRVLPVVVTFISCNKDNSGGNPDTPDHYASTADFFEFNETPLHTYTVNAGNGGSFTTVNGTVVTIPANAFIDENWNTVTGNVSILFKDVYKKSDMLLNDLSTNMLFDGPIKSAGMFYIKAMKGTKAVLMGSGKKLTIEQPLNGLPVDEDMRALVLVNDSAKGWVPPPVDSTGVTVDTLNWSMTSYIYSMYQFSMPVDSGTWSNSDNYLFFGSIPKTLITFSQLDDYMEYYTNVFLIFNDVNAMIHIYPDGMNFPYHFAPLGYACTMVAVGVKEGKLFSAFVPLTITSNMMVSFSLTQTTTGKFMEQLNGLN